MACERWAARPVCVCAGWRRRVRAIIEEVATAAQHRGYRAGRVVSGVEVRRVGNDPPVLVEIVATFPMIALEGVMDLRIAPPANVRDFAANSEGFEPK